MTGAEFRLWKTGDGNENGIFTAEVDENGLLVFSELLDGEYRIVETKAPAGYMPLAKPIVFTISHGVVSFEGYEGDRELVIYTEAGETTPDTFTVYNKTGVALPSTGGSGTPAYTAAGLALMILAGSALIKRKRKAHQ